MSLNLGRIFNTKNIKKHNEAMMRATLLLTLLILVVMVCDNLTITNNQIIELTLNNAVLTRSNDILVDKVQTIEKELKLIRTMIMEVE